MDSWGALRCARLVGDDDCGRAGGRRVGVYRGPPMALGPTAGLHPIRCGREPGGYWGSGGDRVGLCDRAREAEFVHQAVNGPHWPTGPTSCHI